MESPEKWLPLKLLIEFRFVDFETLLRLRSTCKELYRLTISKDYWKDFRSRWHGKLVKGVNVEVKDRESAKKFYDALRSAVMSKMTKTLKLYFDNKDYVSFKRQIVYDWGMIPKMEDDREETVKKRPNGKVYCDRKIHLDFELVIEFMEKTWKTRVCRCDTPERCQSLQQGKRKCFTSVYYDGKKWTCFK
jgi:hypothetical protein